MFVKAASTSSPGIAKSSAVRMHTECPLWVKTRRTGASPERSAPGGEADEVGGKADVEIEGLLSARERTFSRQAQKVRS